MHANLPVLINQVLAENHLHGSCLELEITEGLIMQDLERAIAVLHILRNMSVQLAIDEFGTGYSSLNHLKRFPLDRLKIDKSFVNDITTDPDDAAIIQAVIAMAHSLRLNVIAEGVESEAQMAFLELHHCDDMQGYYFSPPLPAQDVTLLLRENRTHLVTNRNPIVFQVNSFLGLSEDPSSDTGRGA
jgi:EAL domain-containing protein (putative c-di-GMP-specific phosphodiesterase class I)